MKVEVSSVSNTLLQYGIRYDSLEDDQKECLETRGDVDGMRSALSFLVNTLGVSPKNIERCPSVLYLNPGALKKNYEFLLEKGINREKVINCLHVLSTPSECLEETYGFVLENYGVETFNKNVSILATPVSRIVELQKEFGGRISKQAVLSAAITTFRVPEIRAIIGVCEERGIEVTGSFFQKGLGEISTIIDICQQNGIEITGSVFRKKSDELKKIIAVCKEKGIAVTASVFLKDSVEVGRIIDTCRKHGIEITGSVFRRDATEIDEIVVACRECAIPVSGTVFLRTADEIRKISAVCRDNGIPIKANVFKKSADEIEEIVEVCKKHNFAVSTSLFTKSASSLDKSMTYVEDNFGSSYLTPLIVIVDVNHLKKVFPHLEERGTLHAVIETPAILSLKYDDLLERESFISSLGENEVIGNRFNPIYGLSKKRYEEKVNVTQKRRR